MSVNATEPSEGAAEPQPRQSAIGHTVGNLRAGLREIRWMPVLLYGIGAGLLMPISLLQAGVLSFVAGIIPVLVGLLLARSTTGHYGLHGFLAGLVGSITSYALLGSLIFLTPAGSDSAQATLGMPGATALQVWALSGGFIALSLITFCTFGASTSGRIEDRNRQVRKEVQDRGGQLERPPAVREAGDIRGMSLPQFGSYVNNIFKKKGFAFRDYRFIDKDKHLDLWLEYQGEPWRLRLSVADKVSPGTIEGLLQDMKKEGCQKGLVIASTEFLPTAVKSAKGRPIVLIDGETLYQIAEK